MPEIPGLGRFRALFWRPAVAEAVESELAFHLEMRRTENLGELRQDVVYAVRQLAKSPGFTLGAGLLIRSAIQSTSPCSRRRPRRGTGSSGR